jgi:hypothetical protein
MAHGMQPSNEFGKPALIEVERAGIHILARLVRRSRWYAF